MRQPIPRAALAALFDMHERWSEMLTRQARERRVIRRTATDGEWSALYRQHEAERDAWAIAQSATPAPVGGKQEE